MEIVVLFTIYSDDNSIELNYTKSFNSVSVPNVGTKFNDKLFASPKEIIEVVLDYSRNLCTITLKPREETIARLSGHIQEVAAMHNWILVEEKNEIG